MASVHPHVSEGNLTGILSDIGTTGSRPCARGDPWASITTNSAMCFNPGPARGATGVSTSSARAKEFQSTPLREGRHGTQTRIIEALQFQSTPLREGRLSDLL